MCHIRYATTRRVSVPNRVGPWKDPTNGFLKSFVSFGFVTALGVPRIQPSFEDCSRGCVVLRHLRFVRLAHQKLML